MDTFLLLALAIVVLVALLVAGRSKRDASIAPTPLGPTWTPPEADAEEPFDPQARAHRISQVAGQTNAAEGQVREVLEVWDEYLGVLGLAPLPAGHRRRVYDPYNPPVARRQPGGPPIPDQERVARDVAMRVGIDEGLAREILQANDIAGRH